MPSHCNGFGRLTERHRRWLDLPDNYETFIAAVHYGMVDAVMPGLFSGCVKDSPLPVNLMEDSEDGKKLFAESYMQDMEKYLRWVAWQNEQIFLQRRKRVHAMTPLDSA